MARYRNQKVQTNLIITWTNSRRNTDESITTSSTLRRKQNEIDEGYCSTWKLNGFPKFFTTWRFPFSTLTNITHGHLVLSHSHSNNTRIITEYIRKLDLSPNQNFTEQSTTSRKNKKSKKRNDVVILIFMTTSQKHATLAMKNSSKNAKLNSVNLLFDKSNRKYFWAKSYCAGFLNSKEKSKWQ